MPKRMFAFITDSNVYVWILGVFAVLVLIVVVVLSNAKKKPQSPQALVAAALTRPIVAPGLEWKPGMGPQPLIYHPAALTQPSWQPLPGQTSTVREQPAAPFREQGWQPLPGGAAGLAAGSQGIRAYSGPVQ